MPSLGKLAIQKTAGERLSLIHSANSDDLPGAG